MCTCECDNVYRILHASERIGAEVQIHPAAPCGFLGHRRDGVLRRLFITASLLILASLRRRRHRVDAGLNGRRQSCRRPQRLHGGIVVGSMPGLNVKRRSCRRSTSASPQRRSRRWVDAGLNGQRRSCLRPQRLRGGVVVGSMPGLSVKRRSCRHAPRRLRGGVVVGRCRA